MITAQAFQKRYLEMRDYGDQLFDMAVAEQRGYALLGGSKEKCLIIKEAIKEVQSDLFQKFVLADAQKQDIPKEFQVPKAFIKEHGEKASRHYCFDLWRTSELIKLLKAKGTLRKKLGQEEEERLYDDFYIYGVKPDVFQYNCYSILTNCLNSLIDIAKENEKKLSTLSALSNEQTIKAAHQRKRATEVDWEKSFRSMPENILDRKLTSGRTVKEQYIYDRMNKLRQPIDELEFEHRMNNLARTVYEDKLRKEPSFYGNEIESRISLRKLLESLAGKPFSKLSTHEKKKTTKMLFENKDKSFTFFEMAADGQIKVIYYKLYNYKEYLLPEGFTDIVIKFDISGQDFRPNKNYIYSDNRDFEICKQKRSEFWTFIETEQKIDPNIKKIGARLNRIKSNKVFQAAPIKFLRFLRSNYQKIHPVTLGIEAFDMVCGDIRTEAQSITGKNRPKLKQSIIRVVRWLVLWIAVKAEWAYKGKAKVANGKVIVVPKRSYFEKWQGSKNLPEKSSKD